MSRDNHRKASPEPIKITVARRLKIGARSAERRKARFKAARGRWKWAEKGW